MNSFLRAYIHAALWTSDPHPPSGDYSSRAAELETRVDPSWLAQAERDCERFQEEQAALLELDGTDSQNGRDFWLSRNGHGAGFFDRFTPQAAALQRACDRFGEAYLDWPLPDVTEQRDLALALLDWHGGQESALYAVGSCMLADADEETVYRPEAHGHGETVAAALAELDGCAPELAERLRGFLAAQEGGR